MDLSKIIYFGFLLACLSGVVLGMWMYFSY